MPHAAHRPPSDGLGAELARRMYGARTVVLSGVLGEAAAAQAASEILLLAATPEPLRVVMAAEGRALEPALSVHDVIASVGPRVEVIGMGRTSGAAVVAFVAAPLRQRLCLPNARFHLRAFEAQIGGPGGDVRRDADEVRRRQERVRGLLARQTGQPPEQIAEDLRRGRWLSAEEAVGYGLAARIAAPGSLA